MMYFFMILILFVLVMAMFSDPVSGGNPACMGLPMKVC